MRCFFGNRRTMMLKETLVVLVYFGMFVWLIWRTSA